MRRKLFIIAATAMFLFSPKLSSAGDPTTYEVVAKSVQCKQNSMGNMECDYQIGDDVEITIAGVGDTDVRILFLRSNDMEGDYYPSYTPQVGCIIIHPGLKGGNGLLALLDIAFISPKTGQVYETEFECRQSFTK